MGLYLAIFDDEKELDGVEVGSYSDYDRFIQSVVEGVESGEKGSVCPILVLHHDSDGEWTSQEAHSLYKELQEIKERMVLMPPIKPGSDWVAQVMDEVNLKPSNAYESFIDIDGELLVDRLIDLANLSIETNLPILFQ